MKKHLAIITIESGKPTSQKTIDNFFGSLKDGKWKLEASSFNQRSLSVNNYYWMMLTNYVQPALYDAGWREIKTKDDAHLFVTDLFLKEKMVNEETGEVKTRIKSTADLSKAEFNAYLEEIWQWASEYLSVAIPAPNEQFVLYEESEQ